MPINGVEPVRTTKEKGYRKFFYCKYPRCDRYAVVGVQAARNHMEREHGVILDRPPPSKAQKLRNQDLRQVVSLNQQQQDKQKGQETHEVLRSVIEPVQMRQALLRLIVHHDLPLNTAEWPELHSLIYTVNPVASSFIWKSHSTIARQIAATFDAKKNQLKDVLQQSKSLIHLTTDTWHSPNFKEFQAITATFVTAEGRLSKALLNLCELSEGHAGATVAPLVLSTLKDYQIDQKLGFITADNHGANDTLCRALSEELEHWQPEQRRLRCLGHIINLAVQAFLHAKDKEAVELAISQSNTPATTLDEQLSLLSDKDETAGWIKIAPLQKVLSFVRKLRSSDKLYNAFKRLAKKTIRAPNDTRWNSYLATFEDAYSLRGHYQAFIADYHAQLLDCELSTTEWQLVEQTIQLLQPFKEATKQCEGDYITLDQVQLHMDALVHHYSELQMQYSSNKSLSESLFTSWYVFDKYYSLIDDTGAYSAAILLHPEKRKSYLDAAWKPTWIKPGIERARQLWLRYKEEVVDEVIDTENLSSYDRFRHRIAAKQFSKRGANDEFERFINSPPEAINMPVLDWWQLEQQQCSYPQLSRMAIDILSAQAMSADCERVFSGTRRTIPWTRIGLEGSMIKTLTCLKHWQHSKVVDYQFEAISDDQEALLAEETTTSLF
jgi:hypothetical protein